MPIWHCDRLRKSIETFDIGLIKDEDNVAASRRGPRIEVPPLSENLAIMAELAQGADSGTLEDADPTSAPSSYAVSKPPHLDSHHYLEH